MRCKGKDCSRESRRNQLYCSDFCAPRVSQAVEQNAESTAKEKFITREDGDRSKVFSIAERRTASVRDPEIARKEMPAHGTITGQTQRLRERDQNKSSTLNLGETRMDTEITTTKERSVATQPAKSGELLQSLEGESLASMSLIESSAKQLHELMTSIAAQAKGQDRLNPQSVNAAVNCAKQMGQLLKLKIEFAKLMGAK